jgi:hypothetical protein
MKQRWFLETHGPFPAGQSLLFWHPTSGAPAQV